MSSLAKKREFTPEQIAAAEALQIPVEQLLNEFSNPEFIEGMGYKLKVTGAKNRYSKKGAHQVQLTIRPLDGANKEVRKGQFNQWFSYPFDVASTGYKFPTPRDRDGARKSMSFFLKLAKPELVTYTMSVVGNDKIYKLTNGEVVSDDKKVKALFEQDRINVLKACREAEKNADMFVGVIYYAVFAPWVNQDGEKQFSWNYLSAEPVDGKTYITDRNQMFATADGGTDGETTNVTDMSDLV